MVGYILIERDIEISKLRQACDTSAVKEELSIKRKKIKKYRISYLLNDDA